MNIYWYDYRADNDTHDHTPVLDGFNEVVKFFGAKWVCSPDELKAKSDVLAFVHSASRLTESEWEKLGNSGSVVVFVSSSSRRKAMLTPNIFYCPVPCKSIAATITKMPIRVELFLKSCDEKRPDFSLLLLKSPPEILYALYLCRLAKIEDDELLGKLIKEAEHECEKFNRLQTTKIDCNLLKSNDPSQLKNILRQ